MPKRLRPFVLSGILLILASALAALLTGEWQYLRSQRAHAVKKAGSAAAPIPEVELLPDDFALPALNTYEQIVSRPLFMESRRPGQPPSAEPPPPPPPATPPPITLKLMGILSTPQGKMALIADAKGKYKRMKLKDALEGWQIDEIKPDLLRMEQSGFKEELPLLKKRPKGGPGARPPAPVAPPVPAAPPPQPNQPPMQPNRRPMPMPGPGEGRYPPAQAIPGNEEMTEIPDDPSQMQPDEVSDPMGIGQNPLEQ
jgi:hypothetical protein